MHVMILELNLEESIMVNFSLPDTSKALEQLQQFSHPLERGKWKMLVRSLNWGIGKLKEDKGVSVTKRRENAKNVLGVYSLYRGPKYSGKDGIGHQSITWTWQWQKDTMLLHYFALEHDSTFILVILILAVFWYSLAQMQTLINTHFEIINKQNCIEMKVGLQCIQSPNTHLIIASVVMQNSLNL